MTVRDLILGGGSIYANPANYHRSEEEQRLSMMLTEPGLDGLPRTTTVCARIGTGISTLLQLVSLRITNTFGAERGLLRRKHQCDWWREPSVYHKSDCAKEYSVDVLE